MSFTAAASGLVVFLLSVSAVQGQEVWIVICSSIEICAVKGSTVEIRCSHTVPYRVETFWFTKLEGREPVDVTTDSEYAGRVEDRCGNNRCTLRIRNLRESDSAEYRFRITTSQVKYSGPPVTLSVTDLQVSRSGSSTHLQCLSSCPPGTSYIWSKNRQEVKEDTSLYADFRYDSADSYSCALKGYEDFPSPSVWSSTMIVNIIRTTLGVLILILALLLSLWTRKKNALRSTTEAPVEIELDSVPEYENVSHTAAQAEDTEEQGDMCVPDQPEQQEDLQYGIVHFSNNRADPLYSNMRAARPLGHTGQQEVPEYAAFMFSSAAPRTRGQDPEEDPAALSPCTALKDYKMTVVHVTIIPSDDHFCDEPDLSNFYHNMEHVQIRARPRAMRHKPYPSRWTGAGCGSDGATDTNVPVALYYSPRTSDSIKVIKDDGRFLDDANCDTPGRERIPYRLEEWGPICRMIIRAGADRDSENSSSEEDTCLNNPLACICCNEKADTRLSCGHMCCETCLPRMTKDGAVNCGLCRCVSTSQTNIHTPGTFNVESCKVFKGWLADCGHLTCRKCNSTRCAVCDGSIIHLKRVFSSGPQTGRETHLEA
ncbi:hypothetical protein KUCAC02_026913 [Chaenocephalus aceratus]|nr:hypothetical protein KUCAC02_026913 [Chaenocephalus aceratus]